MAKDDYFRLVYAILKELYECKKAGEKAELSSISPQRFKIPDSYWLDILCNQIDEGRIKGIKYAATKTGRTVTQTGDLDITEKGMEYLRDNSMMKKVADALKTVKDIVPGI